MYPKNRNDELRQASGNITYSDPLVSFLYELMRDHLPQGIVEKLVIEAVNCPETIDYTNGWMAQYANNLAEQIRNTKTVKFSRTLSELFDDLYADDEDSDVQQHDYKGPVFSRDVKEEIENELELMRPEIEDAAKNLDPEKDYKELVDQAKQDSKNTESVESKQDNISLDDAKKILSDLHNKGLLSSDQTKQVERDIKEFKNGRPSKKEK